MSGVCPMRVERFHGPCGDAGVEEINGLDGIRPVREWYGYAFGLPDRHPTVFYRGAVRCPHGVGLFPSGRVGNVWRVVV